MKFQIDLTDDQFIVLKNLARLLDKKIEELLINYIDLLTIQATPIYHLVNFIESTRHVLPSFQRAIAASKDPSINMGDVIASLLKEIFNGSETENNLEQIRTYFLEAIEPEEVADELPSTTNSDRKRDISDIIKGILKRSENENDKT